MKGTRSIVLWGICALLVFAPLAVGAVRIWGYTTLLLVSAGLFLVWLAGNLKEDRIEIPRNPSLLPLAAFGVFVCLQTALGGSAYAQASWVELLKLLSYGLVFFLILSVMKSESDQRRLIAAIVLVGFIAAFVGILEYFTGARRVFWLIPVEGIPFGPYGNRNHFAGLMEMCIPLALGLLVSRSLQPPQKVMLAFVVVVMASAQFLSASRGGILSLVLEFVCFAALIGLVQRKTLWLPYAALILVGLGGMLYWLGIQPALARFSELRSGHEPSYESRLRTYDDTWRMIRAHPLLGVGLGTYGDTFPRYRSSVSEKRWLHAHNDYLELLAETGLLGGLLAAAFLWLLFRRAMRALERAEGTTQAGILVGALVGILGILFHSLVDFNLHIPANALMFFSLAALVQAPTWKRAVG